jgi:hypothetical protein
MSSYKKIILEHLCYTALVYGRINKKLGLAFSDEEIEALVLEVINGTDETAFIKSGKNIYVSNEEYGIVLTINSFTNRIITADRMRNE